ncbi:MAG TPA: DegQ family serine endoprotease [Gammaproteobacteria bacterium]
MKRNTASIVVGALAAGALIAWLDFGAAAWPFDDEGEIPTLAPLLAEVTPAVVNVAVVGTAEPSRNPLLEDPFFRRFFEDEPELQPQPQQSIGSGVIVDADQGLIVTNHHVIRGAETIVVTTNDRRQFNAEVVGSDEGTDVALLRVDPHGQELSELPFGDSDEIQVGDYVVAIGNPFGLGQTATAGIVSALGRSGVNIAGGVNVESYEDFIQTDASINPGNSGGALVSLDGRLIGVNTAILSSALGGNIGIGFAIPSNMASEVVEQLLEFGEVRRGRLGIIIQDVFPGLSQALGLGTDQGALVTQVEPGSAAEAAGIMAGDVVIEVNGEAVVTSSDLRNEIGLMRVGETVALTILRDGQRRTINAMIGEVPPQPGARQGSPHQPERESLAALQGADLSNIPPNHPQYGSVRGVLVTGVQPGSPAWRHGLRTNDVITSVNRAPVGSVEELAAAIQEAELPLALEVRRDGRPLFLLVQ